MVINAPFNIRGHNFTLKSEKRSLPVLGDAIAAACGDQAALTPLVDGSGLGHYDADRLLEHAAHESGMWVCETEKCSDGIVFELPGEGHLLESIAVWNYNKPAFTDLGIQTADIAVWTAADGWKTVLKAAAFNEGEGTDDYDEPTIVTFEPVAAEKVRFENMTAFNPEMKQLGLSEVCFYQPLGNAACNPEPGEKCQVACCDILPLSWTAGRQAVAHDVYIGQSQDDLTCLGRIKGAPQVTVSGLAAGDYCWRIDEVSRDGTVAPGAVWSFTTKGTLVGHWPLDETPQDVAGQRNGTVGGQPVWEKGPNGSAATFNGKSDYIEIPPLNLYSNAVTLCAWIKPEPQVDDIPGIVFCRSDKTVAGINLLGDRLRYHWNDAAQTYDWDSGIRVPMDGIWMFVALTIEPHKGTLYFCYQDGILKMSENRIPHILEEFDGPLYIGRDPMEERYFHGAIDDVQVFDFAMSREQIEQIARGSTIAPVPASGIQLVGAEYVAADEDLADIADEQTSAPNTRRRNLIVVGLMVLLVIGFAAVSLRRKKN